MIISTIWFAPQSALVRKTARQSLMTLLCRKFSLSRACKLKAFTWQGKIFLSSKSSESLVHSKESVQARRSRCPPPQDCLATRLACKEFAILDSVAQNLSHTQSYYVTYFVVWEELTFWPPVDRRRSLTFRIGTFKPIQIYLRYYDIFPLKILPCESLFINRLHTWEPLTSSSGARLEGWGGCIQKKSMIIWLQFKTMMTAAYERRFKAKLKFCHLKNSLVFDQWVLPEDWLVPEKRWSFLTFQGKPNLQIKNLALFSPGPRIVALHLHQWFTWCKACQDLWSDNCWPTWT